MSDPNRAPTLEELDAASEYAASKLCVEVPAKIEYGLTRWDGVKKECRITRAGCGAGTKNPLSVYTFSANGTLLDWKKDLDSSPVLKKFWQITPPDHLVWKVTSQSREEVCARANFKLQQFCEFPGQRTSKNDDAFAGNTGKGNVNVPPFRYTVRGGKETCIIGKDYCDSKGMEHDSEIEECYIPLSQKISEFLMSTYLTREMKKAGLGPPLSF
jgi:hypothetical protein